MTNYFIGKKIKLIRFAENHITQKYYSWLTDPEVNKYLYVGRFPVLYNELTIPNPSDKTTIKLAIFANIGSDSANQLWQDDDYKHYIGTATIHCIDWVSRKAEIGYMLGEKSHWGVGIGTELVELLLQYCFNKLNLRKITAGAVEE